MATALTNASAGVGDEFGGDEFSNNLFSDLAPLLTLFGEQVTKQFLSMSLGWADNILLAMGPLGIMTVIVSAIRVGGVRQLKAIVGRARESQSTAEQELLSSTSSDVCELWSGKEIVRLIGSPAGMKNLVVVGQNGGGTGEVDSTRVLDIATACKEDFLRSPGLGNRDLDDRSGTILDELSEAAPNLALNVKNATAKPSELWVCAAIGVALQAAAIVFPGLATYHWKFEKAGTPVPAYGYPCFLVGTLLVIVGVAACGHVIEGITTEHHFTAKTEGDGLIVKKVVRLQRSCTVSDQHFASFAIHNSPDDLDVRTSRLNKTDYSSLAAAATIAAVAGFIAQFIGLRALHWSATIVQLGVTLIMTGIRAYVRRGLATNPICSSILDGHEVAWLAMQISGDLDRDSPTLTTDIQKELELSPTRKPLVARIKHMVRSRSTSGAETDLTYTPMVWELPSLQGRMKVLENLRDAWTGGLTSPSFGEDAMRQVVESEKLRSLFFPSRRRLPQSNLGGDMRRRTKILNLETISRPYQPTAMEVGLHGSIQALMTQHDDATTIGSRLAMTLERLAGKCAEIDAIQWKGGDNYRPGSFDISLPVVVQTLGPLGGNHMEKVVHLLVKTPASNTTDELEEELPNSRPWVLQDRDQLQSVLSLWQYTMAERERAFQKISALRATFVRSSRWEDAPPKGAAYLRVVGYTSLSSTEEPGFQPDFLFGNRRAPQQDWLGKCVCKATSSQGVLSLDHNAEVEISLPISHDWPVFGAFVSELSSDTGIGSFNSDYVIYTDQRTGLVMQCAHEILSLFFLTIASMITKVGGKTTRLPEPRATDMPQRDRTRVPRLMVNSVFRELAQEIVDVGMAHDITEAYTLIIPAFNHYGLLPTRPDNGLTVPTLYSAYDAARLGAARIDSEYRNDNLDGPGEGEAGDA